MANNRLDKLLECQKELLLNSRYEATELSLGKKLPIHKCNKRRIDIYCDMSEDIYTNLCINDICNINERLFEEMFSLCEECPYYK